MEETNQEEIGERLGEILIQIKELMFEAKDLVRGTPEGYRAKSYWIPRILSSLDREHEFIGSTQITMQDTIDSLIGEEE